MWTGPARSVTGGRGEVGVRDGSSSCGWVTACNGPENRRDADGERECSVGCCRPFPPVSLLPTPSPPVSSFAPMNQSSAF